ncbi:MAG: glucosidase family protein [Candidatus Dormibacteria bacterium]
MTTPSKAALPTVEDLRSSPLRHRFGDLFNPPGLTNFLGCVQSDTDVTGFRSLSFPPLSCGDTLTAGLYIDGEYLPATGAVITTTWWPDRIEREADARGLHLHSTLVMAVGRTAVVMRLAVRNTGTTARTVSVRLGCRGAITRSVSSWGFMGPTEDNAVTFDTARGAFMFSAGHTSAHLLQGLGEGAGADDADGLTRTLELAAGETKEVHFVAAAGEDEEAARRHFDALVGDVNGEISRATANWNAELAAVFTPGNDRYSGSLPLLQTNDEAIRRTYLVGVLGVIYFKRDNPASVHGRAYDTLMPRYWQTVTWLWDFSLSAQLHALLDPEVMRGYLERWMRMDIHAHFGTDYLTGEGVGPWYAVNDYAMLVMAHEYVRWSGDRAWLESEVHGQRVLDRLAGYAEQWRHFVTPSGLADYGGIGNLLECVSSYIHEVASLNAGSAWGMRMVASLLGEGAEADRLRADATDLVARIGELYAEGQGYWNSRHPGGKLVQTRHCYDFITVLNTIPDDLSSLQREEMVAFFVRELQTPAWMRALSGSDPDAMFSLRPDHQWTGSYPAWPAQAVTGLFRAGREDVAVPWLRGMGRSANQGPWGQAHYAEDVAADEDGGALKASPHMPYICDWTVSSGGSWVNVVVESLFGVAAGLDALTAKPRTDLFDPSARLVGLRYHGRLYDIDASGVHLRPEM